MTQDRLTHDELEAEPIGPDDEYHDGPVDDGQQSDLEEPLEDFEDEPAEDAEDGLDEPPEDLEEDLDEVEDEEETEFATVGHFPVGTSTELMVHSMISDSDCYLSPCCTSDCASQVCHGARVVDTTPFAGSVYNTGLIWAD